MISVVVPVRNDPERLRECLRSLERSSYTDREVIVVDDASTDRASEEVARGLGARTLRLERRAGPGAARNRGARDARGEIVAFVDADVCVHADALERMAAAFANEPGLDAVFGCYDREPREPNLISQYKNLFHHFVHNEGAGEAATFWAGCGAIRRETFLRLGGFDAAYTRPSIEDIELGVRLRRAGHRVALRPEIQGTHLKRWTLIGIVKSDVWDRAVPWTELILREKQLPDTLNLKAAQRLSAAIAYVFLGLLALCAWFRPVAFVVPVAAFLALWSLDLASASRERLRRLAFGVAAAVALLAAVAAATLLGAWFAVLLAPLVAVVALNRRFYAFFARQKGALFALAVVPLHLAYYLYSGLGFALGVLRHLRRSAVAASDAAPRQPGGLA